MLLPYLAQMFLCIAVCVCMRVCYLPSLTLAEPPQRLFQMCQRWTAGAPVHSVPRVARAPVQISNIRRRDGEGEMISSVTMTAFSAGPQEFPS